MTDQAETRTAVASKLSRRTFNERHFEWAHSNELLFERRMENKALCALLRRPLPFGKYHGIPIGEVPLSYLDQTVGGMGNRQFLVTKIAWIFDAFICLKFLPESGYFSKFTSFNDLLAEFYETELGRRGV